MTEELRHIVKMTAKKPAPPKIDQIQKPSGYWTRICKIGLKIGLLGLSALIAVCICLVWLGGREQVFDGSVAVVLGNQVYTDGRPAPRLAARLDKSLELYQTGRCQTIIVSGGESYSRVDEARAMAAYLRSKGVPEQDIVVDSAGINTWQTALFTADYLLANGLQEAIVVSQAFHVPRSVLALKAAGCPKVGQAAPVYWELWDIYSILREIPANIFYWWRYY